MPGDRFLASEILSNLPLWKRGIEGDFSYNGVVISPFFQNLTITIFNPSSPVTCHKD
jgi:hypothetical protein